MTLNPQTQYIVIAIDVHLRPWVSDDGVSIRVQAPLLPVAQSPSKYHVSWSNLFARLVPLAQTAFKQMAAHHQTVGGHSECNNEPPPHSN